MGPQNETRLVFQAAQAAAHVSTALTVAVMRVVVPGLDTMHVLRAGAAATPLRVDGGAGLFRLVCGMRLFESVPSPVRSHAFPRHLVTGDASAAFPLLGLFNEDKDDEDEDNTLTLSLLLDVTTTANGGSKREMLFDTDALSSCELRWLLPAEQSSDSTVSVVDGSGAAIALPEPCGVVVDVQQDGTEFARSYKDVNVDKAAHELLVLAATALHRSRDAAAMLETEVKFAGILKGLISPIVSPVKDLMGNIVGGTLGGALTKPVATLTTGILSEGITAGVQPALTNYLVDNIVPSLTETVTDCTIETLSQFLSDYITENLTPRLTTTLTTSLTPPLEKHVAGSVNSEGAVKMARKVTHSLTHLLGRSLPHSIVASLSLSLSHSPLMDYYCYYCYNKDEYCQYCTSSTVPSQFFYSMYYAGWYSSYYSLYYTDASQKNFKVEVVRRREVNYEDPTEFGVTE